MEKDISFVQCLLPEDVYKHFNLVDILTSPKQIDLFLDEKLVSPSSKGYVSKGFTEPSVIQDFPLRGKSVFLHIRRRKWQHMESSKVVTSSYDLTHLGTQITTEFAAFLKGIDRNNKPKY